MNIFEKIDTQRHRRDINLCKPVSQPDATGFSGVESDAIDTKQSVLFADNSEEPGAPGKSVPIAKSVGRIAPPKPSISEGKEV